QLRLDLLRVALGAAALWRCLDNLPAALAYPSDVWAPQIASTLLAAAFTAGVATPVSGGLLLLAQNLWLVPLIYRNGNLPSATMAVALLPMIVVPAGRRLSVDAWLMRRGGPAAAGLRRLYSFWGGYHPDRFALGLFASFAAFGALCLSSAVNHLQDPG